MNYKNISPSILKYIEEANELFPQKPYELGAKKSREIFAKHSKSLELKRTKDISVSNDFFTSEDREIKMRIYTPNNDKVSSTGIIYIHGGGWIMGDLNSHDRVCVDLSINCNKIISQILTSAPSAIEQAKFLCKTFDDWNENMKELRDYTLKTTSVMSGGKEGQEGLGAFIERRDPEWHVNNEE